MFDSQSRLSRLLQPRAVATVALCYAGFHLLSGLAFIVTDPSPSFVDNLARSREAFSASALIASVAALTIVVDRFLRVVVHNIIPALRKG